MKYCVDEKIKITAEGFEKAMYAKIKNLTKVIETSNDGSRQKSYPAYAIEFELEGIKRTKIFKENQLEKI